MLTYDRFPTPIGQLTLVKTDKGVCYIGLPSMPLDRVKDWAQRTYPGESFRPAPDPFRQERQELLEYLKGERKEFTFPIDVKLSKFSWQVLREVSKTPYGGTVSYGEVAHRVGHPGAARAVGRAVAANPLSLVIPCHRVLGQNGSLTGYGGGIPLKRRLLRMEGSGKV